MKLEELFAGRLFISDLGEPQTIEENGKQITLGQYAVWAPIQGTSRHSIIEVGDYLDDLMQKYHISKDNVCKLV